MRLNYNQKLSPLKAVVIIAIAIIIGVGVNAYRTKKTKEICTKHSEGAREIMNFRQYSGLNKEELLERLIQKTKNKSVGHQSNLRVYVNRAYDYPKLESESEINEAEDKFARESYNFCEAKKTKVYE